ncbi:LytR C-terminal domain-containing protein [Streptomyces sp. NPDC047985]|uniref:LCP family protein n=1 Tax=Streptomyces sp. NPDC047985 TaxID=3155384 RepID=UPI003449F064
MNDRQNPYDPYYQQPQTVGYDEYGQPVYQQAGPQAYDTYDPYASQQTQDPQQSGQHSYPAGQGGYGTGPSGDGTGRGGYGTDPSGDGTGQGGYGTGQGGYETGQAYGYDPYAQPQQAHPAQPQAYDPYAAQASQQTHQSQSQQHQPEQQAYAGYDGYGYDTGRQAAAVDTTQQWNIPQQASAPPQEAEAYPQQRAAAQPAPSAPAVPGERASDPVEPGPQPESGAEPEPAVPGQRRPDYRTEQFSFIEEPDEDSEDVIDWLKFTESRSERREEARRRGRNRMVALIVVAALVIVGGVGYLWSAGMLPGLSDSEKDSAASAGPQQRDVIVVHLHDTKKGGTSTALLVDNATTKKGSTVLLPNSLTVSDDDGTTTLGKSVDDDGTTGTREAIDTLLGTRISGTWRLDTPYLETLVDLVGNIDIDTDTDVPDTKKGASPLVKKGEAQTLSGRMAVAYATYRAPGEDEAKQLVRFGEVLRGVLRKMSDDPKAATVTVQTLGQILDPSLPEKDLGASLAKLARHAKIGDYKTTLLPVQADGTLGDSAAGSVVKDILGGKVKAPEAGAAVRVGVKNATGDEDGSESARVKLVNGGYAIVGGGSGTAGTAALSEVIYEKAEDKDTATQVAKTLGLPTSAVKQGSPFSNADVSVLLGQDYPVK